MCQINRWWCLMVCAAPLLASVPALHAQESARGQELRHLLNRSVNYPGLDDPKATLTDVLEQLAKRYNLSFDINEHAFRDAHIKEVHKFPTTDPNPLPEMHAKLGSVLQKVLLRVSPSTTYIIRGDVIEITTMKAIRKEFFADRPAGPLPPLVSANFDKVPLESALKELSRPNHSIVLDGRAAKEGQTPVTADLANVPQDTAVRLLADMAGLKMVPLDNVLYVTSKDNALVLLEEQETLRLQRQGEKKERMDKTKKTDKSDAKKGDSQKPKKADKPAP
jgi:hypothetical protein